VDGRLPLLKADIWAVKYDLSMPANTGVPPALLPLVPWQAAQLAASTRICEFAGGYESAQALSDTSNKKMLADTTMHWAFIGKLTD
jgi:hypothetical protein